MNKRGISGIVVTILLILLALVAIIIVWNVINVMIKGSTEQVGGGEIFTTNLNIVEAQVSPLDAIVKVQKKGTDEITSLKIIITGSQGSYIHEITNKENIPKDLETKEYSFNHYQYNLGEIKSISVVPMFEKKSGIEDKKEISGQELVAPQGCVGWWKLEGNADDSSGSANHGVNNGTVFIDDAKRGKVADFDGLVSDIIGDKLDIGTEDFSISLWFNHPTDDATDWMDCMISKVTSNPPIGFSLKLRGELDIYGNENKIRFTVGKQGTSFGNSIWSTNKYNDGLWHHVVAVADRDIELKLYIDGEEDTTANQNDNGPTDDTDNDNTRDLRIGSYGYGYVFGEDYYWNGQIDEVMFFDKALSEEEIKQLYDSQE